MYIFMGNYQNIPNVSQNSPNALIISISLIFWNSQNTLPSPQFSLSKNHTGTAYDDVLTSSGRGPKHDRWDLENFEKWKLLWGFCENNRVISKKSLYIIKKLNATSIVTLTNMKRNDCLKDKNLPTEVYMLSIGEHYWDSKYSQDFWDQQDHLSSSEEVANSFPVLYCWPYSNGGLKPDHEVSCTKVQFMHILFYYIHVVDIYVYRKTSIKNLEYATWKLQSIRFDTKRLKSESWTLHEWYVDGEY